MLTLTEIATPESLAPVKAKILKFKMQQESAANDRVKRKNSQCHENKARARCSLEMEKGWLCQDPAFYGTLQSRILSNEMPPEA